MRHTPPSDDQVWHSSSRKADDQESRQKKIHFMLAGIWKRSKDTVAHRVEILREATTAATKSGLDEPGRLRAVDSAHKLAGVLGTFGLPRGTDLAREVEETFGKPEALSRVELERLGTLLEELDYLVRTADPTHSSDPS
jgi:Hpt domain